MSLSRVGGLAVFAAACLASAEFSQWLSLTVTDRAFPVVWLPGGVLLAMLVRTDPARWAMPVLVAAVVALFSDVVIHGQPLLPALAFAGIRSVEAGLAAGLVRRAIDAPFTLARVHHVWALIVGIILSPVIGGAVVAAMSSGAAGASFGLVWRAWYLSDALGALLAGPLALAWADRRMFLQELSPRQRFEACAVIVGAVAMSLGVFGEALPPVMRVPAYVLPFLLWSAFRLAPDGAALTIAAMSVVGLWHTAQGHGPFVLLEGTTSHWILRSQGAMGAASVSFLLLASVIAERNRVTQERAVLITELQRALAEIKTLQGLVPLCAWCHKVRDDAGFWQQIEIYLQARTDATVSHSICPECTARMETAITER